MSRFLIPCLTPPWSVCERCRPAKENLDGGASGLGRLAGANWPPIKKESARGRGCDGVQGIGGRVRTHLRGEETRQKGGGVVGDPGRSRARLSWSCAIVRIWPDLRQDRALARRVCVPPLWGSGRVKCDRVPRQGALAITCATGRPVQGAVPVGVKNKFILTEFGLWLPEQYSHSSLS